MYYNIFHYYVLLQYEGKKKERKLIEVTPELPEQKKKLPPPPKLGPKM